MEKRSKVGLIGLAVMGQNLALNIADHGHAISVYNRTTEKMTDFLAKNADQKLLTGQEKLEDFVASLERPRQVIILVKAGGPTDKVIESLLPHLEPGDTVLDFGNALWEDTIRREADLKAKGIHFVGCGISGGEEGARFGPSLMPGGTPEAMKPIYGILEDVSAKVDGTACVTRIGSDGAGHYVKMVHNGIEYGDMQMICEAYHLMRSVLGMEPKEISEVFKSWNAGALESFLIEITADILAQEDPQTGKPIVDVIMDVAGQKGTGRWTAISALNLGAAAPSITEAVYARCLSALKDERTEAARAINVNPDTVSVDRDAFIKDLEKALYCSKVCSYAQGFQMMQLAEKEYDWKLPLGEIAQIWRGGCIIRARFLDKITEAYQANPELKNLVLDPFFKETLVESNAAWRRVISAAVLSGIPTPSMGSALAYFDAYRTETLPQNLLQAQRDYFGAHTYERVDKERGEFFHIDWPHPERPELKA